MSKCSCCLTIEVDDSVPIWNPTVNGVCNECSGLLQVAIEAVAIARRIGVPKYNAETWREQSVATHLDHAERHVYMKMHGDISEDQLAHAICRLVMARTLELENV